MSSAAVKIADQDRGYVAMVKRVFEFENPVIEVGILEEAGAEPKEGSDEDLTLLEVATINEFGSEDEKHPPPRPFLRSFFDERHDEIRDKLAKLMQSVIAGRRTKAQILEIVGQWAVGEIKAQIARGIPPPNADSTIAAKGSSTPLIRYGQLRSSIDYRVTDGG